MSSQRLFGLLNYLTFTTATLVAGCGRADNGHRAGVEVKRIVVEDTAWQVGMRIGGAEDDSTLQGALHPQADEDGLYVGDLAARRVMRFDHSGHLMWSFGRSGAGPGEFQQPRDLRLDAEGRVWVLDPPNGRITVLTAAGKSVRQLTLSGVGTVFEMIPLANGGAILTTPDPNSPFVQIDSSGTVVGRRSFPWPSFSEMDFLATQFVTGTDPATGEWITAFRLGDSYFSFAAGDTSGTRHWFVERVNFPKPTVSQHGNTRSTGFESRPTSAARSVTMSPKRVYVLFGGKTPYARRLVDSYSRETGDYVESYLLPTVTTDIEWYSGGLYVLRESPYPEIAYLSLAHYRLP
jgi:hypothetical protein